MPRPTQTGLWTYDFTVITIGSLISMVGNTMAGFAISLLVLDYTGSTFLYMLFNVAFQLPSLVCPVLAGPYLDRMSRKQVICRLDFLCAGIYLAVFLLLSRGWFSYPVLLALTMAEGAINSVYTVAYDSLYPNLIAEGEQRKAYSVSSMLWPIAAMSAPVAAALYDALGSAAPIFAINAGCFFTAACFERTIRHRETHMAEGPPSDGPGALERFRRDLREGVEYIRGEKGLRIITLYFTVSNVCYGADQLLLPFFRRNAHLFSAWPVAAATLYAIVSNFNTAGRFAGGLLQYRLRFPPEKKFAIAMAVYVSLCFLDAAAPFLPIPLMAACFFLSGMLAVTSYTIRAAATQAYVPDGKRARFNGVFLMSISLGSTAGSLCAGALASFLPERGIIVGAQALMLTAACLLMYRGRAHVAAIYNRDV